MRTSIAKIYQGLTRDKFTKGATGRDINGRPVRGTDPAAVRWCALGWLDLKHPYQFTAIVRHMDRILNEGNRRRVRIPTQNDTHGYAFIRELQSMHEEFEIGTTAQTYLTITRPTT